MVCVKIDGKNLSIENSSVLHKTRNSWPSCFEFLKPIGTFNTFWTCCTNFIYMFDAVFFFFFWRNTCFMLAVLFDNDMTPSHPKNNNNN